MWRGGQIDSPSSTPGKTIPKKPSLIRVKEKWETPIPGFIEAGIQLASEKADTINMM